MQRSPTPVLRLSTGVAALPVAPHHLLVITLIGGIIAAIGLPKLRGHRVVTPRKFRYGQVVRFAVGKTEVVFGTE